MRINDRQPSAVLLPLVKLDNRIHVILEERSKELPMQPGAICLPGGRIKRGNGEPEETPEHAVIRETSEELLLPPEQIRLIRPLDTVMAPDGSTAYPFVGELLRYQGTFDRKETARILTVPLAFFRDTDPEGYWVDLVIEPREGFPYDRIPKGKNHAWVKKPMEMLFYQYQDTTIWGMTARVIYEYIRGLSDDTEDI